MAHTRALDRPITTYLGIKDEKEISTYFYQKGSCSVLVEKLHRIGHLLWTGVWINKSKLQKWVAAHPKSASAGWFDQAHRMHHKVMRYKAGLVVPEKTRCEGIAESVSFLRKFIAHPKVVGSLAPSSKGLSKAIVSCISKNTQQRRNILEVGPGTGSFTDRIIKKLNPNDTLYLVEFDLGFCTLLRKKYAMHKNVKIIEGSITDFKPDVKFDHIVSGLPLNAFKSGFVTDVFNKFKEVSKEGTTLSYFEYKGLPQFKKIFLNKIDKENMNGILKQKDDFYRANRLRKENVWWNMTPAQVRHHTMTAKGLEPAPA